ncbi:amino acid permease [Gordonia paraffinivorans]|uniref:amino acid permease n=1 Tax=Gordonia paraffinivorans TaxID=175628 RepID=UPI001E43B47D|nr:amino acid permease [Gordonia paraffinivorans]MCD2145007.1 amino acid permease [Gordonia paraffinivorans]
MSIEHDSDASGVEPNEGYQRGLTARTVQMIAIGGAIGAGLFYGSGAAIEEAGPALILAYALAGLAIFVVMRALGELLIYRPISGGISEYADEFLGRFAGFSQGWTYLLTAALSSCNSGIYSTGRMLRSLAHSGDAPKQLTRLSKRRVPALGICASAAMMVIGVVVNALDPKHAFAYITAVSTVGIIVIWATILLCQMAFRRKVARGELPASDYRVPGAPVTTWLALAFLALVFVLLFFDEDGRVALVVGAVWFACVGIGYLAWTRSARDLSDREA